MLARALACFLPGKLLPGRVHQHLDSFNDAEMMMVTLVTVMEAIKMVIMVMETLAMAMAMRMMVVEMVKMTSLSPRVHLDSLNCAGYRVVHITSSGTAAR